MHRENISQQLSLYKNSCSSGTLSRKLWLFWSALKFLKNWMVECHGIRDVENVCWMHSIRNWNHCRVVRVMNLAPTWIPCLWDQHQNHPSDRFSQIREQCFMKIWWVSSFVLFFVLYQRRKVSSSGLSLFTFLCPTQNYQVISPSILDDTCSFLFLLTQAYHNFPI